MPLSVCSPRSSNARPEPATRSRTVCETSTSRGLPARRPAPRCGRRCRRPCRLTISHFTGVDAGPHLDPEGLRLGRDRPRASDGACRPVKRGEEAITRGVHLRAAEPSEQRPNHRVGAARASSRHAVIAERDDGLRWMPTTSTKRTVASTRSSSACSRRIASRNSINRPHGPRPGRPVQMYASRPG